MIKKIYRLNENEVKKVLKYKKPFFSYSIVANVNPNRLWHSRFAIVLGSKTCKTAVSRNFFRRKYFDLVSGFINKWSSDIVCVIKKWKILDKKDENAILDFERDLKFLLKNIFNNK
ncbi:MAG: hypothetical protein ACD_3C00111G0019 [uncultured bacterium (gcode 4)]|uniref:Uncharacterized protein n=1 Tax=uncultured bacterium (gcode 4) TaxID=1234023 RepID=K2G1B4_9BACT|nr:MAG: hypothetical protein ACD_3C00111G0019 [uncultured bacterium (gcode 4)]